MERVYPTLAEAPVNQRCRGAGPVLQGHRLAWRTKYHGQVYGDSLMPAHFAVEALPRTTAHKISYVTMGSKQGKATRRRFRPL